VTRARRPLLAALSAIPLLALGGGILAGPFDAGSREHAVARATTTSSPSSTSLVCPGPVQVPEGITGSGGDEKLASDGPSDRAGVRSLALDADSSLLFGRVAASTTRQDDQGDVPAPTIAATDQGEDLGVDAVPGELGATTQKISSYTSGPEITLRGSQQEQVLGDAVQTTTTTSGDFRGLSATRCSAPSTRATFLGASTASGASASLQLRNTTDRPATASIQVRTADGPADMGGRSQVVVAPGAQERVLLESIVPDQDVIGVDVSTVGAPLAISLQDTERDGLTPEGGEVLSALPEPARRSVVPGVRIGKGTSASVELMNTSGRDAHVSLAAQGGGGELDLPGLGEDTTVPAGSVTSVPLEDVHGVISVSADSDQEISAVVRSQVKAGKPLGRTIGAPSDLAVAQAAPALRDAGVLALPSVGARGALSLAATDDTSVTVLPVGEDGGAGEPVTVDLSADALGRVRAEDLEGTEGGVAGIVVVPEDPDVVHASWIQTEASAKDAPLLTSIPVLSPGSGAAGAEVGLG
jgi:hypothetical protein